MLNLLLATLVTQSPVPSPEGPIFSSPALMARAFFEFAPSSGRGMTPACACTTPTGAMGETLTFTRTGAATCSKQGLATTGIQNGDLVVCANNNEPRVESSGGVLGLRVEGARTNETLRSQEVENVVWATSVSGVAAPTITANFATAPDGTLTADRVQISACPTVGNASGINQTSGAIASPSSSSVYLKANSGTPSVSICMFGITTGTRACTQFSLNTSTWTRAVVPNVTNTGGMNMEIACENRTASYTGATNTGAADILVWGAQSEAGAYATSYIPTVAAAVTRNVEVAYFNSLTGTPQSVAATFQAGYSTTTHGPYVFLANDTTASNMLLSYVDTAGKLVGQCNQTGALCASNNESAVQTFPGTHRTAVWRVPNTTWAGVFNGVETSRADGRSAHPTLNRLYIGSYFSTGSELDGIVTRVCSDPSPSRCR